MALTQQSLEAGKKGLNKLFFIEADTLDSQYKDVIGNVDNVDETFYRARQLAGLAPAQQTGEGEKAAYDDMYQLFQRDFAPVLFTKGVKFSIQTKFTDQYNALAKLQPAFARSFIARKNIVCANVDNLGFTDTTYGMNSEVLYTTSHSMGGGLTGGNRPAVDLAFGPLALEQGLIELRKQKSARNVPMHYTGQVLVKVPLDLEPKANRTIFADRLAGTNNNDPNYVNKDRVKLAVIDYYTSATAWFLRAVDNASHWLMLAEQVKYALENLPMDDEMMHKWIAYESYIAFWIDWHGVWGTSGA